jgi:hypothetical protein
MPRGELQMKKITRLLRDMIVAMLGLLATAQAQTKDSSDWLFAATIYGWFPDIGGHTELPLGAGGDIDVDISTILDHLKLTAQGSFEFRKGRWGGFTDVVYLDVGESKSNTRDLAINGVPLPATVLATVDFDLKSTFWTLAASYGVVTSDASSFDVLFGARLAHMKQGLNWTFSGNFGTATPPPTTGTRGTSIDQWDAIVGGKGRIAFGSSQKWALPYYFDIGTGDSDFTWQAELGVAYSFGWGDLGVVWRHLDYDLDSNGPVVDMNFSGPAAGVAFRW